MSTYRIEVDPSACSSFGACFAKDPETFVAGADGIAETRAETTDRPQALEAATACPMGAIAVFDETGARVA
jgi:ferredoxin